MRLLMTNVLATALVLFGAATASAFSSNMTTTYVGQTLNIGDTVDVSVFFDATAKMVQFLGVAVTWDPAVFAYVPQPNAATGTPTYILYGQIGSGMTAMNTSLIPLQDPWLLWAGTTVPPGMGQVVLQWYEPGFVGAGGTGNVFIGGIKLQVIGTPSATSIVGLSSTTNGGILQVADVLQALPTAGDFQVNLFQVVPEPTTAVLVGLGLVGLGFAGRRRNV